MNVKYNSSECGKRGEDINNSEILQMSYMGAPEEISGERDALTTARTDLCCEARKLLRNSVGLPSSSTCEIYTYFQKRKSFLPIRRCEKMGICKAANVNCSRPSSSFMRVSNLPSKVEFTFSASNVMSTVNYHFGMTMTT